MKLLGLAAAGAILALGALPCQADQTFWTIKTGAVPKPAKPATQTQPSLDYLYYYYPSTAPDPNGSPLGGTPYRTHPVNPPYMYTPPRFYTQTRRLSPRPVPAPVHSRTP
ncbi:MAG: hypothetical protein M3N13_07315 [Candidatus Eremiobacteraeota bacterium]|nr:hypothetical protein [Candidatus Eremiobacteraeota bacterium]